MLEGEDPVFFKPVAHGGSKIAQLDVQYTKEY